jgi:hypothetical protein
VFAETRVVDVRPLNGKLDGSDGYEVHTESSTALFDKRRRIFRCRAVVFAASSLGTVELLLRLKLGDIASAPDGSINVGPPVVWFEPTESRVAETKFRKDRGLPKEASAGRRKDRSLIANQTWTRSCYCLRTAPI